MGETPGTRYLWHFTSVTRAGFRIQEVKRAMDTQDELTGMFLRLEEAHWDATEAIGYRSHLRVEVKRAYPVMVERCGCTPQLDPLPFDADGDGIGEQCRRCGEYIALVAASDD